VLDPQEESLRSFERLAGLLPSMLAVAASPDVQEPLSQQKALALLDAEPFRVLSALSPSEAVAPNVASRRRYSLAGRPFLPDLQELHRLGSSPLQLKQLEYLGSATKLAALEAELAVAKKRMMASVERELWADRS
jgi:hypothetical protein